MNGFSLGAVLRISASRAAISVLRGSSSFAMYSAGVETLSWPFIAPFYNWRLAPTKFGFLVCRGHGSIRLLTRGNSTNQLRVRRGDPLPRRHSDPARRERNLSPRVHPPARHLSGRAVHLGAKGPRKRLRRCKDVKYR